MNMINSNVGANVIPTEAELLARARAMVPALRARAAEVEKARRVPADIVQSFKDAGFFRILQPKRWGGYEMKPIVFMRLLSELGRGCSSSAWVMMILGVHNWEFGLMDPQAAVDVWGEDDQAVIASSYPPTGTLQEVEGGYILNGRWPTSSGTDHGTWAFLGALKKDANGKPVDRIALLVPSTEYEVIDDWFVFGLAGTGSKSLQLKKDVFVPKHRAHSMVEYKLTERSKPYLYPFNMVFYTSVSSVILGFAQAGVDVFIEQMSVRRDNGTGQLTALSPYVKDRLGNAVAKVRSARARLEQMMAEVEAKIERGELLTTAERMAYMLDGARIGRECEEAMLLLFKCTSARGCYLSNPIQRILRDVLVAANHITQDADNNAGLLGGILLGHEPPPLMYSLPEVV